MLRTLTRLYNTPPREVVERLKRIAVKGGAGASSAASEPVLEELRGLFSRYTTEHLEGVTPEEFERSLRERIGSVDAGIEGYGEDELERQRDLSIKFVWGHDHDFGAFRLDGNMGDRHLGLLAEFCTLFPIGVDGFRDKVVLDVGCWTGGTTLMLAALAREVVALEEVTKYAATAEYLAQSFGIADRVSVRPLSIYQCADEELYDRFDIVYFPGVIYHLSDPLLALRILFNTLVDGGVILVESAGVRTSEPICRFDGSLVHTSGSRRRMNRTGWNWFLPSPTALERMMREAGFDEIETTWHRGRVFAYGVKRGQVAICRAGLSVPGIR